MLITMEFLTEFEPPDLGDEANFFVVARTESFGGDDNGGGGPVGWIEDRTRVTNSPVLAVDERTGDWGEIVKIYSDDEDEVEDDAG